MQCPNCNKEMKKGFLFTSKDGAFSFAERIPSMFENAKKADGFVEVTPLKGEHRANIEAYICEDCRKVVINY